MLVSKSAVLAAFWQGKTDKLSAIKLASAEEFEL